MVVSSLAKFVTPGRVSFVTFWALSVATAIPRARAMSTAFRFSMMGAMVGQLRHDAPDTDSGVRLQADLDAHAARVNRGVFATRRASGHAAHRNDGTADCRDRHDEGGVGIPAEPPG